MFRHIFTIATQTTLKIQNQNLNTAMKIFKKYNTYQVHHKMPIMEQDYI